MKVAVDKFGRILIPKVVRDQLGIDAGTEVELRVEDGNLHARVIRDEGRLVREGNMVYIVSEGSTNVDVVELIRQDREARMRRIAGLDDDCDDE